MTQCIGPRHLVALTLAAILAAGCDGSPTGNAGDALTRAEVELLVYPYIWGFGGGFGQIGGAPEFSGTVDQVVACNSTGGFDKRGAFEGTEDAESSTIEVSVEFTQRYFNCEFSAFDGTIRLNADPGVRARVRINEADGVISYDFRVRGSVEFETSDGRAGRCAIDLTADLTIVRDGGADPVLVMGGRACRIPGSELDLQVAQR
jgi:hypothetical protein